MLYNPHIIENGDDTMANDTTTKTIITDKTIWRDAKFAALYIGVKRNKIGKLCRDGNTFPNARKHPQTGTWTIPDNDVKNARITRERERTMEIERSFATGTRPRPTTSSCNRIRNAVQRDTTLNDVQKTMFVSRINAYEKTWDDKYAKRNNK